MEFDTKDNAHAQPVYLSQPMYIRIKYRIEDAIDDINWIHVAFKCFAYCYIGIVFSIAWALWPVNGHWKIESSSHAPPIQSYNFDGFVGTGVCKPSDHPVTVPISSHCRSKSDLLLSMSGGGRIGLDSPYQPLHCGFTYHPTEQICHILDRFSRLIFIGDDFLLPVYGAFNTYLRQDLSKGALKDSHPDPHCICGHQFDDPSCHEHFITANTQFTDDIARTHKLTPYKCNRVPHSILQIDSSTSIQSLTTSLHNLLAQSPQSTVKSTPLIISLSPTTFPTSSALTIVHFILATLPSHTPILFIGPTAAGHIEIKGRKGNQEIWDFHRAMAKVDDLDVLGVWNLTVQAGSWDGLRFGQEVAMVEAMMVVNWLAYLD